MIAPALLAAHLALALAPQPTEPDPAAAVDPAPAEADAAEAAAAPLTPPDPAPETAAPDAAPSAPSPEPELAQDPAPTPNPADSLSGSVEGPPAPDAAEGPPYYTEADIDALRARYGLEPDPKLVPRKPKWRCLIPDPACGFGIELSATSAYAYRTRQGNIAIDGAFFEWHSVRVAYDVWFNFPAHVQTIGTYKFTRLTLGPKVSVVASDNKDLWANMGVALRYWFGTGKWSPALEFTSALSFKLAGEDDGLITTERSPVGLSADIGLNVGGWGAIIVGGQYDSPLAREEIPEKFRVSAAGQVFVGFRGNILWGAPAVAAVATHAASQRMITNQP